MIYFKTGERKHEKADELLPTDKNFTGIFAIFVARALGTIWDIKEFDNGNVDIRRKR